MEPDPDHAYPRAGAGLCVWGIPAKTGCAPSWPLGAERSRGAALG